MDTDDRASGMDSTSRQLLDESFAEAGIAASAFPYYRRLKTGNRDAYANGINGMCGRPLFRDGRGGGYHRARDRDDELADVSGHRSGRTAKRTS